MFHIRNGKLIMRTLVISSLLCSAMFGQRELHGSAAGAGGTATLNTTSCNLIAAAVTYNNAYGCSSRVVVYPVGGSGALATFSSLDSTGGAAATVRHRSIGENKCA
jgi:hypothetical protein